MLPVMPTPFVMGKKELVTFTTHWKFPTTHTETSGNWSNPTNAYGDDTAYAFYSGTNQWGSDSLNLHGFGFSIPDDIPNSEATILGIEVNGRMDPSLNCEYFLVWIACGGDLGTNEVSAPLSSPHNFTVGGATDLWFLDPTPTPADVIHATDFYVRPQLRLAEQGPTLLQGSVDFVKVRIHGEAWV